MLSGVSLRVGRVGPGCEPTCNLVDMCLCACIVASGAWLLAARELYFPAHAAGTSCSRGVGRVRVCGPERLKNL